MEWTVYKSAKSPLIHNDFLIAKWNIKSIPVTILHTFRTNIHSKFLIATFKNSILHVFPIRNKIIELFFHVTEAYFPFIVRGCQRTEIFFLIHIYRIPLELIRRKWTTNLLRIWQLFVSMSKSEILFSVLIQRNLLAEDFQRLPFRSHEKFWWHFVSL